MISTLQMTLNSITKEGKLYPIYDSRGLLKHSVDLQSLQPNELTKLNFSNFNISDVHKEGLSYDIDIKKFYNLKNKDIVIYNNIVLSYIQQIVKITDICLNDIITVDHRREDDLLFLDKDSEIRKLYITNIYRYLIHLGLTNNKLYKVRMKSDGRLNILINYKYVHWRNQFNRNPNVFDIFIQSYYSRINRWNLRSYGFISHYKKTDSYFMDTLDIFQRPELQDIFNYFKYKKETND